MIFFLKRTNKASVFMPFLLIRNEFFFNAFVYSTPCILVPNLFLPLCLHTFDRLCGDWVDSLMSYTLIGLSYLFGFYIDNVAVPGLILVSKILPYQLHGSSMSEEDDIKK